MCFEGFPPSRSAEVEPKGDARAPFISKKSLASESKSGIVDNHIATKKGFSVEL